MVVFTCYHCGESLQKPKVQKHYQFTCKNVPFLTCVDCLKDFKGDEFEVHTKCVTEDERYAAKGSLPGGITKKGEIRQESWLEMIRSIIDEANDLKPPHRNLLNSISGFSNVPRKKVKFLNFIKCCMGGRVNMRDVEAVWDIIEKYKAKQVKETANGNNETKANALSEKGDSESQPEDKKKKKKKKKNDNEDETNGTGEPVDVDGNTEVRENSQASEKVNAESGQKKKKNKPNNTSELTNEEGDSKNKSKKKKTKKNKENEQNGTSEHMDNNKVENDEDITNSVNSETHQKNKKNKEEHNGTLETEPLNGKMKRKSNDQKSNEPAKKKIKEEEGKDFHGKQKNKHNSTETTGDQESGYAENENDSINSIQFDFKAKILEILEKNHSISPAKLQKAVKKHYLKETGKSEFTEKSLKKYNKKLKKIDNIEITETAIRLLKPVA